MIFRGWLFVFKCSDDLIWFGINSTSHSDVTVKESCLEMQYTVAILPPDLASVCLLQQHQAG